MYGIDSVGSTESVHEIRRVFTKFDIASGWTYSGREEMGHLFARISAVDIIRYYGKDRNQKYVVTLREVFGMCLGLPTFLRTDGSLRKKIRGSESQN